MTPVDAQQITEVQHHFTSGEWGVLITVLLSGLTTMAVTIINTFKVNGARAHLKEQDVKLATIDTQTNGTFASSQAQLEVSRREVAELKAAAAAKAESAAELAAEIRRHFDAPVLRKPRRSTKG